MENLDRVVQRNTIVLSAAMGLNWAVIVLLASLTTPAIGVLFGLPELAGVGFGLFLVLYAVGGLVFGRLMDVAGRRTGLQTAFVIGALGAVTIFVGLDQRSIVDRHGWSARDRPWNRRRKPGPRGGCRHVSAAATSARHCPGARGSSLRRDRRADRLRATPCRRASRRAGGYGTPFPGGRGHSRDRRADDAGDPRRPTRDCPNAGRRWRRRVVTAVPPRCRRGPLPS